ncbi:Rab proteins geranylgeranyltransferase component A [Ascosphaera pollenicola]|nr:Rab proteins geranylgeranyltransferase component A [Ascosphaera pollenicola]
MEQINETLWDVIISGTGLQQSMLALALSRSGKKILHVDQNDYYGGPEAAFSLNEAEAWVKKVNGESKGLLSFEAAEIVDRSRNVESEGKSTLGFPRAYTLSLAPHLLYSRARLLSTLVSSKVFRQLEFLAVGSWWLYRPGQAAPTVGNLSRVPSGREDIFADDTIPMRSKRALIKFLRTLMQPSGGEDISSDDDLDLSISEYLRSKFQVPEELCDPIISLALSPECASKAPASFVLPRVKRHISSIGMLGPGFGAVITKWGGDSEIAQVGCRACAVGGGIYMLGHGIEAVDSLADSDARFSVRLSEGTTVRCKALVGSPWDLPVSVLKEDDFSSTKATRSISIVSSSLQNLFPQTSEAGPLPAAAVVFVSGDPPVYLVVHSSDTGECPAGQCVIYANTSLPGDTGAKALEAAVENAVKSADPDAEVLWTLKYTAIGLPFTQDGSRYHSGKSEGVYVFPPPSLDVAMDDALLDQVKGIWEELVKDDEGPQPSFMVFEDREPVDDDEEEV